MLGPGYERMLAWISECWAELCREIVSRSFESCGITENNPAKYNHFLKKVLLEMNLDGEEVSTDDETEDDIVELQSIFQNTSRSKRSEN